MTPRRWYAIATLMMLVTVSSLGSAATNRVLNGDCEEAGLFPDEVPHWVNDKLNTVTARADGLGMDQTAACLVQGSGVLRSEELFAVTGGETLTFGFDAWEIRTEPTTDVCDLVFGPCEPQSSGRVEGDGVGALVFYDSVGKSLGNVALYVDSPIGETYLHYEDVAVVVPGGAVYAQVLLGGSLALDVIDPLFFGLALSSPTTLTAFDNVFVGN